MHTKHHELNLKHGNKTLIPQASWFPRLCVQQWQRLIEFIIGWSTSDRIQPHRKKKFPQRHWCCRASFMRRQTSRQPSHALFALASIGDLWFYLSSTLRLWSSNASLCTSSSLTSMVDFCHPMQLCFHLLLYPSTVTRKRFHTNACCKAKVSRMETITNNQCSPQTASRAQKP